MYNSKFMGWLKFGEDAPLSLPFVKHPDYDNLPACLKCMVSARDHANMTDYDRDRLYETMCYPEAD